ncbi:MAG: hypothetical protein K8R91_03880, partial [Phycisphaerae bacterium]|nr:hypothetical protein [Phycisphaerae bacterium]
MTFVVIPALLGDSNTIRSLLHQMELHYLSNPDPQLRFALLTDFIDASQETLPEDAELIERVRDGVLALNSKYGNEIYDPFYLFHRRRMWNSGEDAWMGWERKRGKLSEFNQLLAGSQETSYLINVGDMSVLPLIKFVITLDADTMLPKDSAYRLVSTLAHPLNKAEIDPVSGKVVAGYSILQPRIQIKPSSADRSLFTRVFSSDTNLDLYTRAVSDIYQDLFREGSYVGKGIYDPVALEQSMNGRIPQNSILSHDLIEGILTRAALVTEIALFEDFPPHYLASAQRMHRWIRGDWQLLPWLMPEIPHTVHGSIRNDLSTLDRWKIIDNLRRSLLEPAVLLLLLAGWCWLPGSAFVWTAAALMRYFLLIPLSLSPTLQEKNPEDIVNNTVSSLGQESFRSLLAITFLLYEALIRTDAVITTLVRLFITHQRLLQWTTAAHTIRFFGRQLKTRVIWRQMISAPISAIGFGVLIKLLNPHTFTAALPLLILWFAAPQVTHWLNRSLTRKPATVSEEQTHMLRSLARRTWLFFEHFVGPDDHWLPPDHFQEDPLGRVAHRTSPTNIGLLLLSTLAAYDMGYIGPLELSLRLSDTFDGMDGLERYRGHLLNWYDTRSRKPLPPRYVSTVDSGNLAGCMLTLKQGCQDVTRAPVLRWQFWQGFLDTMNLFISHVDEIANKPVIKPLIDDLLHIREQVEQVQGKPDQWASLLVRLCDEEWDETGRSLMSMVEKNEQDINSESLNNLHVWFARTRTHITNTRWELDLLMPWLETLHQPPAFFWTPGFDTDIEYAWQSLQECFPETPCLDEVAMICEAGVIRASRLQALLVHLNHSADQINPAGGPFPVMDVAPTGERDFSHEVQEAITWCRHLADKLESARAEVVSLQHEYHQLSIRVDKNFQDMDFGFLFDHERQVFHIGYNVETGKLDNNHYDLLASEARITSLLAIAKGDVPLSHWLHLARPFTRVGNTGALLSWSGTAFEYLMPMLIMRSYQDTLLDQSSYAAVGRQIDYGHQKGVPWGISESGYYHFDNNFNYQYRAFGVPGLGFKRGLADDLVISPYASILALAFSPHAVLKNIEHLTRLNMLGPYGFYEALDFTPSRLSIGQNHARVSSYMAHHQGMAFLSLTNFLENEIMIDRFHADKRVQSVDLLLQERIPGAVSIEYPHPEEVGIAPRVRARKEHKPWLPPVESLKPQVHYLSNGRYSVLITSAGSGFSRWKGVDLTRWRADTTLDNWGTWIYVKDLDTGKLWSAGYQPTGSDPETHEIRFYPHSAVLQRRDHDISLRMEIFIPPEDDVEIRQITLINHASHARRIKLTSYAEVVLDAQNGDRRHPVFNQLFIESEYVPDRSTLLFSRRPRSADEEQVFFAHSCTVEEAGDQLVAFESNRSHFLGRGRTCRSPAALQDHGIGLTNTSGATLDPVMVLDVEIEVEAHATRKAAYIFCAASTRQDALTLARSYQDWGTILRSSNQARFHSDRELTRTELTSFEIERFQTLLSALLYPHAGLRAPAGILRENCSGQSGLWRYAISGDNPILLVCVSNTEEISLVRELLLAHKYWRNRAITVDLVIINMREAGYEQDLSNQLHRLLSRTSETIRLNQRGGIFLLRADQMEAADLILIETAARVFLDAKDGSLSNQLKMIAPPPVLLPQFVSTSFGESEELPAPELLRPASLLFDNSLGGFSPDGKEYVLYLKPGQYTPAPWTNVIAYPRFGFLTTESGMGCTWAENSGENRLTPWNNDPVSDIPGEAIYLRDETTGAVWSPTPLPARSKEPYLIRHGAGYSIFEHHSNGLKQRMRLFAVPDAPVKIVQLRITNTWNQARRITATYFAEWVLGTTRETMGPYIVPQFDSANSALLASNPYSPEFKERIAFLAASREVHAMTTDRTEFLGSRGSYTHPAALNRIGLTARVTAGIDSCAAMQILLWLAPGEEKEVTFLLGQGQDQEQALRLIRKYREMPQINKAWTDVQAFWNERLDTVRVKTPDPAMDLMLNRWLLYQALSCRIWGRSAFYQSSGAFGFRDQLQDVMAMVHADPGVTREHILESARHQFEAGDVLHWWHPPASRGVRTRCSDDLLWLPCVTAHYVSATGDVGILDEQIPFLKGDPLQEEELDRYGLFEFTKNGETLYEHCRRAIEKGITAGVHGLPLIGS